MIAIGTPVADRTTETSTADSLLDRGAFGVVLKTHRREGYDAGYRRAIADVLAASVFVAEKALRDTHATSDDARRAMYAFIELLEKETLRFKSDESFIEGGGI